MSEHLLYIAAPYTRPDPVMNTHRVCQVATFIVERTDWVPVVPHLTLLWHAIVPREIEWWYAYDLRLLSACDALLRLPGESTGADREVAEAIERGIPVLSASSFRHEVQAGITERWSA